MDVPAQTPCSADASADAMRRRDATAGLDHDAPTFYYCFIHLKTKNMFETKTVLTKNGFDNKNGFENINGFENKSKLETKNKFEIQMSFETKTSLKTKKIAKTQTYFEVKKTFLKL